MLLVEDDPMLLDIGRSMLERLGYTLLDTGARDEGVRFIQKPFSLKDLAYKMREAMDP